MAILEHRTSSLTIIPSLLIDMPDLFLKDSIYCAIGLGSHALYDAIDFDSWLSGQLSQEVQNADPR